MPSNKQYDNNDRGVLFPLGSDNPKAPTYTGRVTLSRDLLKKLVDLVAKGQEATFDISAWTRQGNKGEFLSIAAKEHQEFSRGAKSGRPMSSRPSADPDDEIPF